MRRLSHALVLVLGVIVLLGADGCSSDPNVEGAKLDLRNKDYDRAIENLNTALEKNPDNTEALVMKGNALREKAFMTQNLAEHTDLITEMMEAYNRAAELEMPATNEVAIAYYREFERGVQSFNKGSDDASLYATAAQYFQNTSMIMPDSAGPYVYGGYALLNSGNTDDAISSFEMGIENGDTELQTYIYLGELYRDADRAADSVELLEKAEQMWPDDPDLQAHLLNSYQASGMMDRAMAKYKDSIESDPENKTFRYNYGSLLLEAEDFDGAIEHLSYATKLDETYVNAWYNLGAAYQNKAFMYNTEITAMDDSLRANRSSMSPDDVRSAEGAMDELAQLRRENFSMAISPLETAKSLTEAAEPPGDVTTICIALYQAYVQTNQLDKAEGVSACAGYEG